ncbi:MAG: hypothetical protein AAB426_01845 [Myxococcota bacterium]
MDPTDFELPDWLKQLARDFLQPTGDLVLPQALYERWRGSLLALDDATKPDVALVLVALAAKFYRHVDKRATPAMEQLTELAALALGSKQLATDAIEAVSSEQRRATRMVEAGATAGPQSGLAAPQPKRATRPSRKRG